MMRRRVFGFGLGIAALGLSVFVTAAPGGSPIADAAMQGDRDTVRTLLKQAADVNAPQGDGMTALHWAAMKNDADLTDTLLYAGANVRATTRIGGYTPLILAAREGYSVVMEPLLKSGADANGTTALMLAAQSGSVDAVTRLLDAGADLHAKEPVRGLTAIMFAAASDRAAVVELLAKRGADVQVTSSVIDLNTASRNNAAFAGVLFGNPAPPPPAAGTAGRAATPAGGREVPAVPLAQQNRFDPRAQGKAGIDRQYQLNELIYAQGGLAPIHLAARQGFAAT